MVPRLVQALALSSLFALLAAGGSTTFCNLLSLVGVEAHHHACEDASAPLASICSDDHGIEEHGDEPVPCPKTCEIAVDEAATPVVVKVSTPPLDLQVLDFLAATGPGDSLFREVLSPRWEDPPDWRVAFHAPAFTGRFLI